MHKVICAHLRLNSKLNVALRVDPCNIDECTSRGNVAVRIVAKTRTVDRDRLSEFVDLGEAYRRVKKFATKNQFFDLPQDEQMSAIAFILIVERGPVESSLKDCIAEDAIIKVLD